MEGGGCRDFSVQVIHYEQTAQKETILWNHMGVWAIYSALA